jgi:hypothetical protein
LRAQLLAGGRILFGICGGRLSDLIDLDQRPCDLLDALTLLLAASGDLIDQPFHLGRTSRDNSDGLGDLIQLRATFGPRPVSRPCPWSL